MVLSFQKYSGNDSSGMLERKTIWISLVLRYVLGDALQWSRALGLGLLEHLENVTYSLIKKEVIYQCMKQEWFFKFSPFFPMGREMKTILLPNTLNHSLFYPIIWTDLICKHSPKWLRVFCKTFRGDVITYNFTSPGI